MRRISETTILKRLFIPVLLLLAGCSLEKQTGFNRAMQNLTAHYNILFDANEILRLKQQSYALSFVDSYSQILSVYQDTAAKGTAPDKDLEEAKVKAGKIINVKEQSHYLGDAYLVLGKADYLEGDYFDAVEFFSYVIRSFKDQPKLTEEALAWKTRSLLYLNQLPQAKSVIDSAIQGIVKKTPKATITNIYAAKLQYDIDVQDYEDGEAMAKKAIHYCSEKSLKLRWTFILAQLQELDNKTADAYKNYTSIVNSNAPFEMAFNASLNRIRIDENQSGIRVSRIDRLKALLKNENNKDFIDQVYFQIGELYYAGKDVGNAIKNYRLSVRTSRKNQNQKGLSYLRLADIFFKDKADYVAAKKYYDSTLLNLSPTFPGYQMIQKKSNNLQLLADRFGIIAREDTLQMLAKLDDKARAAKIDALVNADILQQQQSAGQLDNYNNSPSPAGPSAGGGSAFYFYNSNAVSTGYNDFKRRWGNRKLEDNWRRSNRASSDITSNAAQNTDPDAPADQTVRGKGANTAGNYRQQLIKNIPLTPEMLAQSNTRIYNAYFDIANFYRDVMGDKPEAIATYELLLARFPDTQDKPAIYYNLYRLYSDIDKQKSDYYKALLLKNYADTPFAKIIVDPNYASRLNDADAQLNESYNQVYDQYAKADYKGAIASIDDLQQRYPNNKWSAQLAYLRAISAGHLEKFDPFKNDLQQIVAKYPDDKLVTPLVKQHLAYLDAHKDAMSVRPFVLTDKDPNEEPFVPPVAPDEAQQAAIRYNNIVAEHQAEAVRQAEAARQAAALKQQAAKPVPENTVATNPAANTPAGQSVTNPTAANPDFAQQPPTHVLPSNPPVTNQPASVSPPNPATTSVFSMRDSTNYYFVINVTNVTTNLASSRFGIGQFNRANFQPGAITHQMISVGDSSRLIYVGRFFSLAAAKDYARAIIPLMPDIMKVPKDEYSFFLITQENLDKLTSKKMLDSYIDFYQNNY
ncbi:MAG TPA: tetratricopeptide repeat protein [Mucilaginibacter sp.]|nr:tetratricopeptide repeat protein [Mucilaginibacter sp.]